MHNKNCHLLKKEFNTLLQLSNENIIKAKWFLENKYQNNKQFCSLCLELFDYDLIEYNSIKKPNLQKL